jgi:xanthine/uracil permease
MAVGLAATDEHPVNEVLPFGQMFIYGLQHVLSMYAGVVAVPLIVGTAFKLSGPEITYLVSAGLFISGLATLLQTIGVWKFGARQPIVQGTSFAAVSTILAVGLAEGGGVAGLRAVFGALLVASVIALLIAPIFTKLLRFFHEQRFGRVLIRTVGRSAEEIRASLESRLGTDEETERSIVADQLREIALLRLAGVVAP